MSTMFPLIDTALYKKPIPEWAKKRLAESKFTLGDTVWFDDYYKNGGVLCKVKHGNVWVENIPVKIKGIFICRNYFAYIADSEDIPKEFPALWGSNTFTDAIPV